MPGGPQPVGAGGQPGQPPFGSSPVTQPTPNRGLQAAALSQVALAVRMLEKALPMLGVETEPGKDVMRALPILAKHVPPGAGSPGAENSGLQQMMMQQKQEQPMLQVLRAMQAKQAEGGAPGGAPGAPPSPAAA